MYATTTFPLSSRTAIAIVGLVLLIVVATLTAPAAKVSADPLGNDGACEHANSQAECREDPQPDHGKDCEAHGANLDGNEDHCLTIESVEPPIGSTPQNPSQPSGNSTTPTNEVEAAIDESPSATPVPTAAPVEEVQSVLDVVALPFSGSGSSANHYQRAATLAVALGLLLVLSGVGTFALYRKSQ
jgi:hypothetical protein